MQADDSLHGTNDSDGEGIDLLETWMLMEFCERGSLERAIKQGKFRRAADGQPEMVRLMAFHSHSCIKRVVEHSSATCKTQSNLADWDKGGRQ